MVDFGTRERCGQARVRYECPTVGAGTSSDRSGRRRGHLLALGCDLEGSISHLRVEGELVDTYVIDRLSSGVSGTLRLGQFAAFFRRSFQ